MRAGLSWRPVFALALLVGANAPEAQERPIPFADLVACARAANCSNMQPAKMGWYDVFNIPVLSFKQGETAYALGVGRNGDGLVIFITPPVESPPEPRPSCQIILDSNERVLAAELGPQLGEKTPGPSTTTEEMQALRRLHRAYSVVGIRPSLPGWGEEFKTFWEEQAKQAVAAIRRQIAK